MYRAHSEKRHEPIQSKITLDQLVPQDHLVRRLDRHIDFSIVHRLCAPLYSNTGTPGIDPEIIIKIILLGPLFNIRSVRQTRRFRRTSPIVGSSVSASMRRFPTIRRSARPTADAFRGTTCSNKSSRTSSDRRNLTVSSPDAS